MQEKISLTWLLEWGKELIKERIEEKNTTSFATWVTDVNEMSKVEYDDDAEAGTCYVCAWKNGDYESKSLEPTIEGQAKWYQLGSGYWVDRGLKDLFLHYFDWREEDDESYVISFSMDDEGYSHRKFVTIDETFKNKVLEIVNGNHHRYLSESYKEVTLYACIEHAKVCQVCDEGYVADVGFDYNNSEALCLSCASENIWCDSGDHWTTNGTTYIRSYTYCYDCAYEEGYERCDDCDDWYHQDSYCGSCDDGGAQGVHSYSYKPDPLFGWVEEVDGDLSNRSARRGVLFMGLEIEVECKSGRISNGVDVLRDKFGTSEDYIYLKTDGSLNHGFEIVTHPRTLASHKSMDLQGFKALADAGFRGWNTSTCGIHVHVNRDGFNGVPHQWRWTRLFANNQAEFVILAGRDSNQWATFSEMKQKLSHAFKYQRGRGDSRYEAINLTNYETFEVRIFKSSLNPQRIAMIMELIDATVEYTRHLTVHEISDHALEWEKFAEWVVSEQSLKYPNLITYCEKYGIISADKVSA